MRFQYALALLLLVMTPLLSTAQLLPPLQPEQDCINAIPVCQSTYFQPNSYQGEGLDPNEITPALSCLGTGEKNDVWYIFTVTQAGLLDFTITPVNMSDDYDWAVYNLTNNPCSDIATNASLEVSCNYSGASGITGATASSIGTQIEPPLPVQVGQTYVLNVSNFSSSSNGYTLDFTNSSAVISDATPPVVDSVAFPCGVGPLEVYFSENVLCNTVDITDFTLIDPNGNAIAITGVFGPNCTNNGTFDSQFQLQTTPAITLPGLYQFSLVDTVLDNCGNVGVFSQTPIQIDTVAPDTLSIIIANDSVCNGDPVNLSTNLSPSVNYTFNWQPGGLTTSSISVTPSSTTNYTLTTTDPSGCTNFDDQMVTVFPSPTATFTASATSVCQNNTISINYIGTASPNATYTWDFAGGVATPGTGPGPHTVVWNTAGSKTVSLTVTEDGCTTPVPFTQAIQVQAGPTANYLVPTGCFGSSITFTDQSTAATSWEWDFGDGNGSTAQSPNHAYASTGSYNVQLVVSGGFCNDTISQTVSAFNSFDANFNITGTCLSTGTQFTPNISTTQISTYDWDFGDGNSGTSASPLHTYNSAGTYNVQLTAIDTASCIDDTTIQITVYDAINADFSFTGICENDLTSFNDLSSSASMVNDWRWIFGDGNFGLGANPVNVYPNAGIFNVMLIASNDGCSDTSTQTLTIWQLPTADFSAAPVCEGFTSQFIDNSQGSSALSYEWNFDGTGTSTQSNPSYTFNNFGSFTPELIVTDANACADTISAVVEVYENPYADFTATDVCFGQVSDFTDISTVSSSNILAWEWDLGDGATASDTNPSHTYAFATDYDVQLWVTTAQGCEDSIMINVNVYDQPIAYFEADEVCAGAATTFNDESEYQGPLSWSWDFGSGTSSIEAPSFTFASANTYNVSLTISNANGCTDTYSTDVLVQPNPVAAFAADRVCRYEATNFQHQASVASPGQIGSFSWDFGDGNTGNQSNPNYYYQSAGTYNASMTVTSTAGCQSTASQTITVDPTPYVYFDFTNVCQNEAMPFNEASSISTGTLTNWDWDFGDGMNSTLQNPSHLFDTAGNYTVSLSVTSAEGCRSTRANEVTIYEIPAEPIVINDTICAGSDAILRLQLDGVSTVEWYEDMSSTQPFFTGLSREWEDQLFDRVFYVNSVANGCRSDLVPIRIEVLADPTALILASDTVAELPNAILVFAPLSSIDFSSYEWNFGDGSSSTDSAPAHEYTRPGMYRVTLTASDESGCQVTSSRYVEIKKVQSLFVPTAFSPNGDGYNDQLFISATLLTSFNMQIFNRWGDVVYETEATDFQWDGVSIKGSPVPEGVYAYRIEAVDIEGRKISEAGTITVIR